MSDPIHDYLDELLRGLPYDRAASRLVLREARDHLLCTTERYQLEGVPPDEARAQAVRDFGSIDDFIQRFQDEGGPMPSRDWKPSVLLAAFLTTPAAVFVLANLLAFEVFGNRVLYNAITPVFDQPWSAIVANMLVTLGPIAALALSLKQIVTLRSPDDAEAGTVAVVRLSWPHLLVALIGLVLTFAIGGYLFFENLPHF